MVVASFGYLRAAELVIDAFAQLVTTCPSARLWLVGAENSPGALEPLLAQVSRARARRARQLHQLGRRRPECNRRIEATAVAIQPRNRAFGEQSAALGDLLAAGVPTIVTDTGSAAAIPAGAVVRVYGHSCRARRRRDRAAARPGAPGRDQPGRDRLRRRAWRRSRSRRTARCDRRVRTRRGRQPERRWSSRATCRMELEVVGVRELIYRRGARWNDHLRMLVVLRIPEPATVSAASGVLGIGIGEVAGPLAQSQAQPLAAAAKAPAVCATFATEK